MKTLTLPNPDIRKNPVKLIATLMALTAMIFSSFALFNTPANAAYNKNNSTEVNELLGYINKFRTDKGLAKVKVNTEISKVSLNWSSKMADTGVFEHSSDYYNQVPSGWESGAEIIAYNSGSVKGLYNQWVKSAPHNAIMSDPDFNIVGIGLASNKNGILYGTVNWFKYSSSIPGTSDKYPSNVKQTFRDVPPNNIFFSEIEELASTGVSRGWDHGSYHTFRPLSNIKRDAMIVFIYRAMGSPAYTAPKKSPFTDVKTNNVFYKEIAWAYDTGIAEGWKMKDGSRQFRPLANVKRDAVAAFLMRASGEEGSKATSKPFADVKTNNIFADEIKWMRDTGISNGWGSGSKATFRPLNNTKRDAMAAFVVRWMDYTGYNGS